MRILPAMLSCVVLSAFGQDAAVRLTFDKTADRMANTGSNSSFTFTAPAGATYATVTRPSGRVSSAFDTSAAQPLWVLNGSPKLDARNFTVAVSTTPATGDWKDVFNVVLDLDNDGVFTAAGNDRYLSFQRGSGATDFRVYYYQNTTSGYSVSTSVSGVTASTVVYIVFSVNNGVASFYVNGVKPAGSHTIAPVNSETASVYGISLGRRWTATNVNASNKVDDMQLFDRGLSDAEVAALYANFQSAFDVTATLPEGVVNWNDLVWLNTSGEPVTALENLSYFKIEAPAASTLSLPEGWAVETALPAIEQLQFTITGNLAFSGLTGVIAPAVASVANGAVLNLENPGWIPTRTIASGGTLRLAGGAALGTSIDTLVDSSATLVIDKAVSNTATSWAGARTLKITENGAFTVNGLFRNGAGSGATDAILQTGGVVNANGAADVQVGTGSTDAWKKGPCLLGYWGSVNVTYSISGGTLTVPNGATRLGVDGTGHLSISGTGVANLHSVDFRRGTLTLGAGARANIGKVTDGSDVMGFLTATSNGTFSFAGGTLAPWESTNWKASVPFTFASGTTSTLDLIGSTALFSGNWSGTGSLAIANSGETTASLTLTASTPAIGTLTQAAGIAFEVTGSLTAAAWNPADGAILRINDTGRINAAAFTPGGRVAIMLGSALAHADYDEEYAFLAATSNAASSSVFTLSPGDAGRGWVIRSKPEGANTVFFAVRKRGLLMMLY